MIFRGKALRDISRAAKKGETDKIMVIGVVVVFNYCYINILITTVKDTKKTRPTITIIRIAKQQ